MCSASSSFFPVLKFHSGQLFNLKCDYSSNKRWLSRQARKRSSSSVANKRGERGSSKDGNSAAKEQNMAACEASPDNSKAENVFEPSEEKETSLNELKALLEGVQQKLLEMCTKNQ